MLYWCRLRWRPNDDGCSAAFYVADVLIEVYAEITVYDPKASRTQMLINLNYLGTQSPGQNEGYLKW